MTNDQVRLVIAGLAFAFKNLSLPNYLALGQLSLKLDGTYVDEGNCRLRADQVSFNFDNLNRGRIVFYLDGQALEIERDGDRIQSAKFNNEYYQDFQVDSNRVTFRGNQQYQVTVS